MTKKKSVMPVQHGLDIIPDGTLQTLWIEIPGRCDLACPYCFARGGESLDLDSLINNQTYTKVLEEAKSLGVKSIGIPGAGEPFFGKNRELTMWLLEEITKFAYATLFTTIAHIDEELADRLAAMAVEIMVKYNSRDPDVQNAFVSDPSRGRIITDYAQKRDEVLEMLMEKGFNKPCVTPWGKERETRLAIVTSIMTGLEGGPSNYDELPDLLRYARKNNIIFDCDAILERGRGATCKLHPGDKMIMDKQLELQKIDREEFRREVRIGQGYYGTVCNRHAHHLYVNQYGEIRPCVGAMDVNLGNIKTTTLAEAWEHPAMVIIRNGIYKGKCGDECDRFAKKECESCLGRCTKDLTVDYIMKNGHVKTIGCAFHRPKEK